MNEKLYDALVKVLEDLTAASTNIKTSKYEIFLEARRNVPAEYQERYAENKGEVDCLVENFCLMNNFTLSKHFNGNWVDLFINTEPVETTLEVSSRNRVYIPAEYTRQAGFTSGDYVYVAQYDGTNDMPIYEITRDKPDFKNTNIVRGATVEKHGGIRFTVPFDQAVTNKQVTVGAGVITVAA